MLSSLLLESYESRHRSEWPWIQIELTHIAWRKGYRIKEIPIIFEDRQSGESKMSSSIIYEALWVVWVRISRSLSKRTT